MPSHASDPLGAIRSFITGHINSSAMKKRKRPESKSKPGQRIISHLKLDGSVSVCSFVVFSVRSWMATVPLDLRPFQGKQQQLRLLFGKKIPIYLGRRRFIFI